MELKYQAWPKVNLCLYVGKKQQNGYHNVSYIAQLAHNFYDDITVSFFPSEETLIEIEGMNMPQNENLAYKAAEVFVKYTGVKAEIKIKIEKHIPMNAGLGGGSSDAACVLRALNDSTGLLNQVELQKLAFEVGSDVVFFVSGYECAYVGGQGEELRYIKAKALNFELFNTNIPKTSTREAYNKLDTLGKTREYLPSSEELEKEYRSDEKEWNFENDFSVLYPGIDGFLTGSGSWAFKLT